MGKKKVIAANYVDKIPMICEDKTWRLREDGLVEVTIENTGFYNRLAQKLFKKPRFSYIKLEGYGSFVWQQIDGQKTIYEIGQNLAVEYEAAGNQLYERLCVYFETLHRNGFISFRSSPSHTPQ